VKAGAEVAAELMTSPVVTVRPEDTLARAARHMHRAHVMHLASWTRPAGWWASSAAATCKPYLRSDESIRHGVSSTVLE
jgi:predicted transcriptional regulator